MPYAIGRPGEPVRKFVEKHELEASLAQLLPDEVVVPCFDDRPGWHIGITGISATRYDMLDGRPLFGQGIV